MIAEHFRSTGHRGDSHGLVYSHQTISVEPWILAIFEAKLSVQVVQLGLSNVIQMKMMVGVV